MKQIFTFLIAASLLFIAGATATHAGEKEIKQIKKILTKELPGDKITSVKETPIKGIYEVIAPPKILYVSGDAKHIISGDIINVATGENLTLPKRDGVRVKALEILGQESMIVYKPKGKTKHTVTVFTDIDCGYCRKLHNEMADYNKLGIKIRYLAYPRAGIGSESYDTAVSVWCAKNRNDAMDRAKSGLSVPKKSCDNPVKDHYRMGERLGIRGTPALVLESGQVVPGYVPADRLFAGLEQQKKAKN